MTTIYKAILEWAWVKISSLLVIVIDKLQSYYKYKKIIEINDGQAKIVEDIRQEIIALMNAGKVVPDELKERLRMENDKLTEGTFDPRMHK